MSIICTSRSLFAFLFVSMLKLFNGGTLKGSYLLREPLVVHRYYTEADLLIAQGFTPLEDKKKIVVYCRVSSNGQKPELLNQISAILPESFRVCC